MSNSKSGKFTTRLKSTICINDEIWRIVEHCRNACILPSWRIQFCGKASHSATGNETDSEQTQLHKAEENACPGDSMSIRYRVIKVKGSEPERFIVIGIDFSEHMVKSSSRAMEEAELREHLREAGASDDQIKAWIQQGRAYPG
jgi:hypothetical protein